MKVQLSKSAAIFCVVFVTITLAAFQSAKSYAGDIVYRPINPSFGGNPLNGGYLQSLAEAQKPDFANGRGAGSSSSVFGSGQSNAERFISSLESRLLSSLSAQVADSIFGDNPQDSGRVVFGDTEVTFSRGLETIQLTITDPETGTTLIEVPILQVQ